MIRLAAIVMAACPAVAACSQTVSPERAYEQCSERARLAEHPRGRVGVGAGSDGVGAGLDVTITSDFIVGRDPYLVYDTCFRNLTGAGPTRPLVL